MKRKVGLLLISILLASCDNPFAKNSTNFVTCFTNGNQGNINNSSENNPDPNTDEINSDDVDGLRSISFLDKSKDLVINKTYSAIIQFDSKTELSDEDKEGTFSSKDESIASVSKYGVVTGKKSGKTLIYYTTNKTHLVAAMTIYVWESLDSIQREYKRVDDVDTINEGDELIFACPSFNVGASINSYSGYILTSSVSFSSDKSKIVSFDDSVAQFYVGPSSDGASLTFETQDRHYLSARETTAGTRLGYSKNGKAQINWIIERPSGFSEDFIVNSDIQNDYWLMFNKVSSSDIRFNIYDSNELATMIKPTIYRNEVVRN